MSLRDRIDRLGHLLEVVAESVEAVRSEHDDRVRERRLVAVERTLDAAREAHAALVEEDRKRPKLRLLGILIPVGLGAFISRTLRPLRRRRTAVVASAVTVGMTTAALAAGALVLDGSGAGGGPTAGAAPATSAPVDPPESPQSAEPAPTPDGEEDLREQLAVETPGVLGKGGEAGAESADPSPDLSPSSTRGEPAGSASTAPADGTSGSGWSPQPDPSPSRTDDQGGTGGSGGQPSGTPTPTLPPGETPPPDDEPDHDGLICIKLGLLDLDVCLL